MNQNVFTRLCTGAEAERPLLRDPVGRVHCTYGQMRAMSARYAQALARLGVGPGDRVAVQADKSSELVMLYLGVLRLGAVYLPLNSAYTLPELEYFLTDAEPRVLVGSPERHVELTSLGARTGVAHVHSLCEGGGTLAALAAEAPAQFADTERAADDLAAILYTSGTTGRSKGAMLTQRNLTSNALALQAAWQFSAEDVLLHALPLFHIHGLFVALNTVLAAGASLLLLPQFDTNGVLESLPRASVLMGVPTFYVRLLQDSRLGAEACAHMRLFVCGSAPLLADTHRAWRARTGQVILERYGMTEAGILTSNPYAGERRAGSVGLPLPGVDLRVVGEEGGECAPEQIGMIEVRGPNVFRGYWRQPDKSAAAFRDGFFITGDLGRVDGTGYVHIDGRAKDLIITGGFNVYPKEVELELDALPGVRESAVFGVAHPDFGEGVTAAVWASGPPPEEEVLLTALRGRLAAYKCPKRIVFVEELPRNTMGKVQKNRLRERFAALYARA